MIFAPDSQAMTDHAISIGLIPKETKGEIATGAAADRKRPATVSQALEDAGVIREAGDQP